MWRIRYGGNKYKSVSTVYSGVQYHSKGEAGYAAELDLRLKAKDIKAWRRQVKVSLDVNGRHIANYFVDFVVTHLDDTEEYVEYKGFSTEVFRLKRLLFEALYPDIRYTLLQH